VNTKIYDIAIQFIAKYKANEMGLFFVRNEIYKIQLECTIILK